MRRTLTLLGLTLLAACGSNAPSASEVRDSVTTLRQALAGPDQANPILQTMHRIFPERCGATRPAFAAELARRLTGGFSCAAVTTATEGDVDVVTASFGAGGCVLGGHVMTGALVTRITGRSDEGLDVETDFSGVTVDGRHLQAKAGYGQCGDDQRVWESVEGDAGSVHYKFDTQVELIAAASFFGDDYFKVDGVEEISGKDFGGKVTLRGVQYVMGDFLPRAGRLSFDTRSGHHVEATFRGEDGKAELVIDDGAPVIVPVPE